MTAVDVTMVRREFIFWSSEIMNYRTNKLHELHDDRCYGETRSRGGREGLLKGKCSVEWPGKMVPRRLGGDLPVRLTSPCISHGFLSGIGGVRINLPLRSTSSSSSNGLDVSEAHPVFSKSSVSLVYPHIYT